MNHSVIDERVARTEVISGVVLAFDTHWKCDSHRDMYYRIIRELAYDPADVFEMRITEAAIEVDCVDFENSAWPLMTRRHACRRHTLEPTPSVVELDERE